jgi:hypothetical protein
MAQRDAVIRVVPEFRVRTPRFQVMNMQSRAAVTAILTCPPVTVQDSKTEGDIPRCFVIHPASRSEAALPVRVVRADKMRVARRNIASPLDAIANSLPMFSRKRFAPQCSSDVVALSLRDDAACGCRLACARICDLRTRDLRERRVALIVQPGSLTGTATKLLAASGVSGATLVALPSVSLWHVVK